MDQTVETVIDCLSDHFSSRNQLRIWSKKFPLINDDFTEVKFTLASGGDDSLDNIKISKGEESNFIWCVFYSLLQQVIDIRNTVDKEERSTQLFNDLEFKTLVFLQKLCTLLFTR